MHREGSENFAALVDYTEVYKAGAERFGMGESAQFYLLPMALAALAQIEDWTPARIQQRLREWTDELAARAQSLGLGRPPSANRVGHMIGLKAPHGLPVGLASALADRGIYVAVRGDNIRVAPHLHSPASDIDRLINALKELIA